MYARYKKTNKIDKTWHVYIYICMMMMMTMMNVFFSKALGFAPIWTWLVSKYRGAPNCKKTWLFLEICPPPLYLDHAHIQSYIPSNEETYIITFHSSLDLTMVRSQANAVEWRYPCSMPGTHEGVQTQICCHWELDGLQTTLKCLSDHMLPSDSAPFWLMPP